MNGGFLDRGGLRTVLAAVAGFSALFFGGAGVSAAATDRHAANSHGSHGSKRAHGARKLGDYTVILHSDWGVQYPQLPLGSEVTVTYISTPGGCTTNEHGAKFTLTSSPFGHDINPVFDAKSSGSCGFYASYADYNFAVKLPNGDIKDNRIRVQEDGTSGNYSVDCGKTYFACVAGFARNHKAVVTFRW